MVDSMFVTKCTDTACLCHEKKYQKVRSIFPFPIFSCGDESYYCPCLSSSLHCASLTLIFQSLFQCLYAQCDRDHYGPALSYTISACLGTGADINMVSAPGQPDPGYNNDKDSIHNFEEENGSDIDNDLDATNELLRAREADYLEGREYLHGVPGLDLRQESAPAPIPPIPIPTQQPQPTTLWLTPPCAMTRTATMLYTTTATVAYVPSPTVRGYGLADASRTGNGSIPDAAAAVGDATIAAAAATSPAPYPRPWLVRTSAATPGARPSFPLSLSLSLFLFSMLAATACTGVVIWILLSVVDGGGYVVW